MKYVKRESWEMKQFRKTISGKKILEKRNSNPENQTVNTENRTVSPKTEHDQFQNNFA